MEIVESDQLVSTYFNILALKISYKIVRNHLYKSGLKKKHELLKKNFWGDFLAILG